MLERLELLIGKENLVKLRNVRVLVIGVGGVGGYAVEALARSGIGSLVLVDPDVVEESNVNRQLVALSSTIGQKKVDVLKSRVQDIGLDTNVDVFYDYVTEENIDFYLNDVDFIVDACDSAMTKLAIMKKSLEGSIPLISCMGTGNKMDPSRLTITELSKTNYDPLAKKLRKLVRDFHLKGKIMVVSSKEEKRKKGERIIPSNAFVPGSAGLLCASYVINQIISR